MIHRALDGQGTPGLVFCHLSHAYADGASLYFTFISRARQLDPSGIMNPGKLLLLAG